MGITSFASTAVDRYAFNFTFEYRSCLWCGRHLRSGKTYFDTDRCGRAFAEQLAARGLRISSAEEVVDVAGDVVPHPP